MPISADLGDALERFVDDLVKTGRYGSKSEVLREGVRLVQEREARLTHFHNLVREGLEAAEKGETDDLDEVFDDLLGTATAE
ncbi:MAG: type II toxin-antitoxin system ParD family antitoxin [Roseitalea porphyridii]|jgi:antitoxin ParD1/3/4|uniref:type II toxin-antitoxin system ParD family antitoxin n=1 Tax=Roseitalea porphyridii TaxID=1852022 RepID=UPI0032EBE5A9